MQEEESYSDRQMQDRDSDGHQPDQEEEGRQEGRAIRMILFKREWDFSTGLLMGLVWWLSYLNKSMLIS